MSVLSRLRPGRFQVVRQTSGDADQPVTVVWTQLASDAVVGWLSNREQARGVFYFAYPIRPEPNAEQEEQTAS